MLKLLRTIPGWGAVFQVPYGQATAAQAAEGILRQRGNEPMSATEIAKEAISRGWKSKRGGERGAYYAFRGAFKFNPDQFEKVERGKYRLTSEYFSEQSTTGL